MISCKPWATGKVILSRARKRDGAPTVASRFLQRMAALGGNAWETCRERGEVYLRLAEAIDRRGFCPQPSDRPLPRPPADTASEAPQRHPNRDIAARSLCHLCRKNSASEATRSSRRCVGRGAKLAARSMPRWSALSKAYPWRASAIRCPRNTRRLSARSARGAIARRGFRSAPMAAARKDDRFLSRVRSKAPRSDQDD